MAEYKMCANEDMAIYILDFIKRGYEKNYKDTGVQKYLEALQMGIDALGVVDSQKAEIERLQNHIKNSFSDLLKQVEEREIKSAKSEAIKEFAERLKAKFNHSGKSTKYGEFTWDDVTSYEIDNLVKEMTGD